VSPRFAYFYLMKEDPDRVGVAVPRHVSHWHGLGLTAYLGGPFEDRSGGLITFEAGELREAERVVNEDPFRLEGLLDSYWIKEWAPE
jgi:uncharacterized protein YciI